MRKLILAVLSCCVLVVPFRWGLTHCDSAAAEDAKPSALSSAATGNPQATAEKQILFICTGNYYRSRYAQACFNLKAQETKLDWTAVSRGLGIKPGRKGISPLAATELSKRGVPETLYRGDPEPLTEADLNKSDYIVVMDETEHRNIIERRFPNRDGRKFHYWEIPDYPKMTVPAACAAMSENIDHLLKELAGLDADSGQHESTSQPRR